MNVLQMEYRGYRNLQEGGFSPSDGINVIYGKNANGKTNLLEAMWLFTGGRSFRGSRDSDLCAIGGDSAQLCMRFFSEDREQKAEITVRNGRRSAVLNGVEKRSASALVGKFCAVIFSPDHLSLVKEGPVFRRNFLDGALCQLRPAYARLLGQYNRTLSQRNALLKDIPRHGELMDTLEIWDDRLAALGASIMAERLAYTEKISGFASGVYAEISQEEQPLSVSYQTQIQADPGAQAQELARLLFERLSKSHRADVAAGFTTIGPHRDDLELELGGKSARVFGSQGQQRSVVLSLKLAEAQMISDRTGERPVIFLDDVMSELDAQRQDYLLNRLEEKQVFITCCDPDSVKRLRSGRLFEMKDGVLHAAD